MLRGRFALFRGLLGQARQRIARLQNPAGNSHGIDEQALQKCRIARQ
jgi:hypothetical protein